jgi:hypothetical protein
VTGGVAGVVGIEGGVVSGVRFGLLLRMSPEIAAFYSSIV